MNSSPECVRASNSNRNEKRRDTIDIDCDDQDLKLLSISRSKSRTKTQFLQLQHKKGVEQMELQICLYFYCTRNVLSLARHIQTVS